MYVKTFKDLFDKFNNNFDLISNNEYDKAVLYKQLIMSNNIYAIKNIFDTYSFTTPVYETYYIIMIFLHFSRNLTFAYKLFDDLSIMNKWTFFERFKIYNKRFTKFLSYYRITYPEYINFYHKHNTYTIIYLHYYERYFNKYKDIIISDYV